MLPKVTIAINSLPKHSAAHAVYSAVAQGAWVGLCNVQKANISIIMTARTAQPVGPNALMMAIATGCFSTGVPRRISTTVVTLSPTPPMIPTVAKMNALSFRLLRPSAVFQQARR